MFNRRAFTIVELLVVVAIIGLLTGLVLTGIMGATQRSKKMKELNRLRQIHLGWTLYANNNNDACIPGFVDPGTQTNWKLKCQFQNGNQVPQELAQTYVWRLAGYIGYSLDPVLGNREDFTQSLDTSEFLVPDIAIALPASLMPGLGMMGAGAAYQPAFGYNAYYLGGWWTTSGTTSQMRFVDGAYTDPDGSIIRGRLVSRNVGGIHNPTEVVVFASSTYYDIGTYKEADDFIPGAAWVCPSMLADEPVWGFGGAVFEGMAASSLDGFDEKLGGAGHFQVYMAGQGVPLRRHGEQVATVRVDGSTEAAGLDQLLDMRKWIPSATKVNFTHTEN
ncbi:MAG: type II secretion system protein [Planctomycetota bacterium]|nr:type II secretion system protein [Planctomycetota bacterium]